MLGWIRRDYNISNSLTKIAVNDTMKMFILKGEIEYTMDQFVVGTPKPK